MGKLKKQGGKRSEAEKTSKNGVEHNHTGDGKTRENTSKGDEKNGFK